jgi:hypothetical protein
MPGGSLRTAGRVSIPSAHAESLENTRLLGPQRRHSFLDLGRFDLGKTSRCWAEDLRVETIDLG